MRLNLHDDVEVAVFAAERSGVSLARNADARTVAETRGEVDREWFGPHFRLIAAAFRTMRLGEPPRSAAVRTRFREHHVAARRFDRARTVALQTSTLRRLEAPAAAARAAMLAARDGDLPLPAAHRVFEADGDRLVEIRPALGSAVFDVPGPLV